MQITAKSYHAAAALTAGLPGNRLELPDGATVAQALERLGAPAALSAELVVFVNGRPRRPDWVLNAGDTLVFFDPIAGG